MSKPWPSLLVNGMQCVDMDGLGMFPCSTSTTEDGPTFDLKPEDWEGIEMGLSWTWTESVQGLRPMNIWDVDEKRHTTYWETIDPSH